MSYITIKLRRGTAAQWTASNPVLAEGEAGLETDTRKFKVGDGLTAWSSLSYWQTGGGGGASAFTDLSDVPASYSGQGLKLVRVKADASGLEFFTYTIAAGDLPTGIDAAKIADGTVSNAEFQYLNGVTSAIQTQLNGKAATVHTHVIGDVTGLQSALDNKQPLATVLTNTTASFTTADETKLDYISVTQAVNLDTLETDSHTHSNKATLDNITAAFTTAQETKLGNLKENAVVSSSLTAVNDTFYINVTSATYTDPSPVEGKGFTVLVRNGTATIGGTGYSTAGRLIYRIFHSGAWATYDIGIQDLSGKQDTLVSATNIKTINGSSILGSGDLTVSGSGGSSILENQIFS
jgi:hypothetical protein